MTQFIKHNENSGSENDAKFRLSLDDYEKLLKVFGADKFTLREVEKMLCWLDAQHHMKG